jgi:tocopherol O-methyltransferase
LGSTLVAEQRPVATSEALSAHHYYHAKTAAIIERYGPGPRVHYHIGLFDDRNSPSGGAAQEIRAGIVSAQERMVERVASTWDAATNFAGKLLDVGCGLGGGAIYWAQHFPVQVTALTNVTRHAAVVRSFAVAAGVADRVRPVVTDIADLRSASGYAAAVAMESSCYIPRPVLFQRVAAALEPGGVFGIEDIFHTRPASAAAFDQYWKTRVGTVSQYQQAAEESGILLDRNQEVPRVPASSIRSVEWARARLAEPTIAPAQRERLMRSIRWHGMFLQGWRDGSYEVRILRFRKPLADRSATPR